MRGPQFPRAHASSHYGGGVDPIPGIPPFSPYAPLVIDVSEMGGDVLSLVDQIVVLVGSAPEGFRIEMDNSAIINSYLQVSTAAYGDPLITMLGNSLILNTDLVGSPTDVPTVRLFELQGSGNRLVRTRVLVDFDQASAFLEVAAGSTNNHMIDCESGRDDVDRGGFILFNGELLVHGGLLRIEGPTSPFQLAGAGGMAAMNFNFVGLEPNAPAYLGLIDLGANFGTIRNAGNIMSRLQAEGAIFDPSGLPLARPALEEHSPGSWTTESAQPTSAPGDGFDVGTDVLLVDSTLGPTSIPLPEHSATRVVSIQDVGGAASTDNITVTPASGTINGAPTATISTDYGSLTLRSDGTNWTFN